jgi:hypothetical protein
MHLLFLDESGKIDADSRTLTLEIGALARQENDE